METLALIKWPLIALLIAVVAGCAAGGLWGRHQLKKARGELRPVLNTRQRIICAGSLLLGLACVLTAMLYNPSPATELDGWEEGDWDEEVFWGGEENPGFDGGTDIDLADGEFLDGGEMLYWDDDGAPNPVADEDELGDGEAEDAPETDADDVEVAASVSGGVAVARPAQGGNAVEVEVRVG